MKDARTAGGLFLLQQWIYFAAAASNVSIPLVRLLLGYPQEHEMYFM